MAGRDKLGDESRVDHRATPHQALQRIDEVVHVDDAALQQISAPLAAGQETHGVLDLDMRGKDKDGDVRKFRTNLAGCVEAFGGVTGRHPNVDDHQFRPPLAHKCEQLRRGCALPHDIEARALEQTRETLAQQDVVVCQRDLDPPLGHLYDYDPFPGQSLRSVARGADSILMVVHHHPPASDLPPDACVPDSQQLGAKSGRQGHLEVVPDESG